MPLVKKDKSIITDISTQPAPEKIPLKNPTHDPYEVNLSQTSISYASATGESGAKRVEVTMDLEEHPNKKFMARYHRYEPKVKDSTAIKTLKTCARLYFYQIVLGRVSKESQVIFAWGSAYHTFKEVLETEYGFGPDRPRVYDATHGTSCFVKAAQAGLAYWKKHGKDQEEGSKFAFMTAGRLMLSFKADFLAWELEKKQGKIHVLAVEQPIIVQLSDGSYTGGKCDQLVKYNGQKWGRDWKTTTVERKYYERFLEPNDQFTRYTLMEGLVTGEQIQGQLIGILYNNNNTKNIKKGPEVYTLTTSRTKYQLEQFEMENVHWNRVLALHREHDIWPMEEQSCSRCAFHMVCKKSTEGGMMAHLEQYFTVRPWDFTRIGEE